MGLMTRGISPVGVANMGIIPETTKPTSKKD
jgi:hypothetical protein